jgi:Flp pilus assembly pilin Flp
MQKPVVRRRSNQPTFSARGKRLHDDVRGANLVEYLLIVGVVALGATAAAAKFGGAVRGKTTDQASCVQSLDGSCSQPGSDDSDGPVTGAAAPAGEPGPEAASPKASPARVQAAALVGAVGAGLYGSFKMFFDNLSAKQAAQARRLAEIIQQADAEEAAKKAKEPPKPTPPK